MYWLTVNLFKKQETYFTTGVSTWNYYCVEQSYIKFTNVIWLKKIVQNIFIWEIAIYLKCSYIILKRLSLKLKIPFFLSYAQKHTNRLNEYKLENTHLTLNLLMVQNKIYRSSFLFVTCLTLLEQLSAFQNVFLFRIEFGIDVGLYIFIWKNSLSKCRYFL